MAGVARSEGRGRPEEPQHGRQRPVAVETWILPALGTKRLRELQPEDVETLLATMVAQGRSRSAVNRVRAYFAQALTVAERRGKGAERGQGGGDASDRPPG
ncbi:MAG: hypothetical protein M3137_03260 [Actinomycetota bacterium]|nr:hypothetical protein [Actinomycetota bacterium]